MPLQGKAVRPGKPRKYHFKVFQEMKHLQMEKSSCVLDYLASEIEMPSIRVANHSAARVRTKIQDLRRKITNARAGNPMHSCPFHWNTLLEHIKVSGLTANESNEAVWLRLQLETRDYMSWAELFHPILKPG